MQLEISLLFDFAQSRGLDKEWNFVAESFLAPEGHLVIGPLVLAAGANASGQELPPFWSAKASTRPSILHLAARR